jgi:murein DD-endopeptidase MepM/ murein hydrolase activator NlpD
MELESPGGHGKRKYLEQTAQTLIAALLLGTASGCATIDYDGRYARPPVMSARPGARPQTPQPSSSSTHIVASGDTIYSIARMYGVSPNAIIAANELQSPNSIYQGERLAIPSVGARQTARVERVPSALPVAVTKTDLAPPAALAQPVAPAPAVAMASADGVDPRLAGARYYNVGLPRHKPEMTGEGGPEFSNARAAHAVDPTDEAFQAPRKPQPKPHDVASADPDDEAYDSPRRAHTQERQVAAVDPADEAYDAPRSNKPAAPTSDVKASNHFVWPVRGQIISGFGKRASGVHNDGINIAAEPGSSVKAADGGIVVYAGNELAGYGNLLLIRHSNGFVTAYAHNKKLLVGKGDEVHRGQTIATVGSTGDVDRPQLHFEIRKGDRAVDPARYLETANAGL